jgi:hypothetical protein
MEHAIGFVEASQSDWVPANPIACGFYGLSTVSVLRSMQSGLASCHEEVTVIAKMKIRNQWRA